VSDTQDKLLDRRLFNALRSNAVLHGAQAYKDFSDEMMIVEVLSPITFGGIALEPGRYRLRPDSQ
jgi:hypothetical protein